MIRRLCMAGLFTMAAALLLCTQLPTSAQGGKKDDVAKLQKTVKDRDAQIQRLTQAAAQNDTKMNALQQRATQLDADLKTAKSANVDFSKEVEALRKSVRVLDKLKKAPFLHVKILKLKKDDDEQVMQITDEAGNTLAKIEGVRGLWIGKRAEMGTPKLAQKDYQLGVVVLLDDADALQKFLDDPLHKQFADKMGDYWEQPVVYDIQRDLTNAKKEDEKK